MSYRHVPKEGGTVSNDFFKELYDGALRKADKGGRHAASAASQANNNNEGRLLVDGKPTSSSARVDPNNPYDLGWVSKENMRARYRYPKPKTMDRGVWTGKADFLVSMIAYAVGLGNVWRFPYLCHENGGGAFFVPYFLCWLLAATPIFFMEVAVGQFFGKGGISVWQMCPILKGVGWANQSIASMCNVYYCVIVAWALFYVLSSFTSELPWTICGGWWTTSLCRNKTITANSTATSTLEYLAELAKLNYSINDTQTPVEQFWERRVLQTSNGIDETGYIQWELCLMLIGVWAFTYFALRKGITKARKVLYVCACSPYVLLFILLIRGLTLDGASDGIVYYLQPRLSKLSSAKVWRDAGTQIFYSFGIGFGTLVALGSYNTYHHNVYRDAVIMCFVNSCTSILAGFVVFSVLGYMAQASGKSVEVVVKGGVGLAFLVYPEAIVTLPLSQLWSVLFFIMIMILGLDSQVCTVEGVITAMCDQFPLLMKRKKIFVALLCIVNCILGFPMITQSGQYWLKLIDTFGASGITLLFVMFFEVVGLSWGFGAERIYLILEDMLGYKPSRLWLYCWKFTAPLTSVAIFIVIFAMYQPLRYSDSGPAYPDWSQVLGLLMSLTSMIMIPAYAIYYLIITPGKNLREKLKKGLTPSDEVLDRLDQIEERRRTREMNHVDDVGLMPHKALAPLASYEDDSDTHPT